MSTRHQRSAPVLSDLNSVLAGLRAASESTRLRIVAVLAEGELTVSELCRILGQTQPRVSRHLKLLCDAGLLVRHSEGTSAFYSPANTEPGRSIFSSVLALVDPADRTLTADRSRLDAIRTERASNAGAYFEQIAGLWDNVRSLHVDDAEVEQALLDTVANHTVDRRPVESLLDIGTGTGRILEMFAPRINHGLGIDLSAGMLNLARSNLVTRGFDHCSVRHGNIYALDVPDHSYDLAILHHVLHFLEDPAAAIAAATRTLRPGGLLIIVDFAPHQLETLRQDHAHRRLGFTEREVLTWCKSADLTKTAATHFIPTPGTSSEGNDTSDTSDTAELLTVSLWTAVQRLRPKAEKTKPPASPKPARAT